jgi:hypothetical protein
MGVLGSCASPCITSYLASLVNTAGLTSPAPLGRRQPMSPEARERSFDELASGLASGTLSRRRALRLMGGALVGSALASLGIGEAAADPPGCKRNGKRCKKNRSCCSSNCVDGMCQGGGGGGCSPGDLVTPVGGGDPFCACAFSCQASCVDCPPGYICVTEGPCTPGGPLPVHCAQAC